MSAFIVLVKTYLKNKQIPVNQGNALIVSANSVINQLKVSKGDEEADISIGIGIDSETGDDPATITKLGKIYPNPSRDAVTIEYEIADSEVISGKVMIQVYDVIGRVVANLVNSTQEQGHYSVTWSSTSKDGNPLPRGVYFIRLKAGFTEEIKLVMLVR
jgi:hypothetical protein